jgi:hypothetical protein
MDGKKFKMTIKTKGIATDKWLEIAFEMIKVMYESKKEENKSVI